MITGDIYNEQIACYEFASDFISKRVLITTNYRFLDYFSSKLLLKKNVAEIISWYCYKNKTECTRRKKGKNDSIKFETISKNSLFKENSFDGIISFDTIQYVKNQKEALKNNYKLLKKDGILVISTINKDISQGNHNLTKNKINNELDELQFLKMLKEIFSEVDLFSQNISINSKESKPLTKNHLNKIRGVTHKIRLKIFIGLRIYSVYRLFFNETISSKTKKEIEHFMLDIRNTEYFPRPYVNGDQPLFFVAVCRK